MLCCSKCHFVVTSIRLGSHASTCGLDVGDALLEINGHSVVGEHAAGVSSRLMGPMRSLLMLRCLRGEGNTTTVKHFAVKRDTRPVGPESWGGSQPSHSDTAGSEVDNVVNMGLGRDGTARSLAPVPCFTMV